MRPGADRQGPRLVGVRPGGGGRSVVRAPGRSPRPLYRELDHGGRPRMGGGHPGRAAARTQQVDLPHLHSRAAALASGWPPPHLEPAASAAGCCCGSSSPRMPPAVRSLLSDYRSALQSQAEEFTAIMDKLAAVSTSTARAGRLTALQACPGQPRPACSGPRRPRRSSRGRSPVTETVLVIDGTEEQETPSRANRLRGPTSHSCSGAAAALSVLYDETDSPFRPRAEVGGGGGRRAGSRSQTWARTPPRWTRALATVRRR